MSTSLADSPNRDREQRNDARHYSAMEEHEAIASDRFDVINRSLVIATIEVGQFPAKPIEEILRWTGDDQYAARPHRIGQLLKNARDVVVVFERVECEDGGVTRWRKLLESATRSARLHREQSCCHVVVGLDELVRRFRYQEMSQLTGCCSKIKDWSLGCVAPIKTRRGKKAQPRDASGGRIVMKIRGDAGLLDLLEGASNIEAIAQDAPPGDDVSKRPNHALILPRPRRQFYDRAHRAYKVTR